MAKAEMSQKKSASQHLEMIKPERQGKGPMGGCMSGHKKDGMKKDGKKGY